MLSLAPSIELFFLHGDRCRGGGRWNCSVTTQSSTNALSPKGLVFLPFAMETLGGLHSGAVTQVKQLAATLARCKGSNESEVTSQLFGRLSLALMRVNAMMLSTRCHSDDFPLPKIDGIMWLDNLLLIYTQHFSGNIHFHLSPKLILRDPPALR